MMMTIVGKKKNKKKNNVKNITNFIIYNWCFGLMIKNNYYGLNVIN